MATREFTVHALSTPRIETIPGWGKRQSIKIDIPLADVDPTWADWIGINLRLPTKNQIYKKIYNTALNDPKTFILRNNGIELSAASITVSGNVVKFKFSDLHRHGIVDGGHTHLGVTDVQIVKVEKHQTIKGAVTLTIWGGLSHDEVCLRSQGINFSNKAQEISRMNQMGYFDGLKDAMQGVPGEETIIYQEGDQGKVNVGQIAQMFMAFHPTYLAALDDDEVSHPSPLFRRQSNALEMWAALVKKEQFGPIVERGPDILQLHDAIAMRVPALWAKSGKNGGRKNYGCVKCGKGIATESSYLTHFTTEERLEFGVDFGLTFPILSAFRANVDPWGTSRSSGFKWRVPNSLLLDKALKSIVTVVSRAYEPNSGERSPWDVTTRDNVPLHQACFLQCQRYVEKFMDTEVAAGYPDEVFQTEEAAA